MQTHFSLAALADPDMAASEKVLRTCVHCGFCTATCPTYVLLGDELDSPRGRIYLIKDMLERDATPSAEVVTHIDRCLSCLSCMTTCPAGVDYAHLIDHGRRHVEEKFRRPMMDRLLRLALATVLPRPWLFRLGLLAARPLALIADKLPGRLGAMTRLAPARIAAPDPGDSPRTFPAEGVRRKRVGILTGCAQKVLAPAINAATVRLLTRHGCEVVVARGVGCCGALPQHMGREAAAHGFARAAIDGWTAEIERGGLDAIVINASGCGTTVKDYGRMLARDPAYAAKAARIAGLARDVTELMSELGLAAPTVATGHRVAYHSACSLQHGQRVRSEPKALLAAAGFTVLEPAEGHLCCGSAGTYNLLQPGIAGQLRDRKVANIERTRPDLIAAGNIGCLTQIASGTGVPVVHTVELLDWATGGPRPAGVKSASVFG